MLCSFGFYLVFIAEAHEYEPQIVGQGVRRNILGEILDDHGPPPAHGDNDIDPEARQLLVT